MTRTDKERIDLIRILFNDITKAEETFDDWIEHWYNERMRGYFQEESFFARIGENGLTFRKDVKEPISQIKEILEESSLEKIQNTLNKGKNKKRKKTNG